MRRPDGVTVIAIYHFVTVILYFIGACAIIFFALLPALADAADGYGAIGTFFGLGIGLLLTFGRGVAGVVAGWGLLALKEWARWLTIALALLSLLLFPIGTIIGAFIIWYLLQPHVREAFVGAELPVATEG